MPKVSGLLGSLLLFTVLSLTYYYIIVCALRGSYGTSLFPGPPLCHYQLCDFAWICHFFSYFMGAGNVELTEE